MISIYVTYISSKSIRNIAGGSEQHNNFRTYVWCDSIQEGIFFCRCKVNDMLFWREVVKWIHGLLGDISQISWFLREPSEGASLLNYCVEVKGILKHGPKKGFGKIHNYIAIFWSCHCIAVFRGVQKTNSKSAKLIVSFLFMTGKPPKQCGLVGFWMSEFVTCYVTNLSLPIIVWILSKSQKLHVLDCLSLILESVWFPFWHGWSTLW